MAWSVFTHPNARILSRVARPFKRSAVFVHFDADQIDFEKAEKISRLGYEIIEELGLRTVF